MAGEIFCAPMRLWLKNDKRSRGCMVNVCRYLTSGEVSTALRPFYFNVHPDLFGQFPSERAVNENSLQILSSFLENLQQNRFIRPTTITFYLKPQKSVEKVSLKSVRIQLSQRDVRKTVVSILSSCDLPTTYVDSITPTPLPPPKPKPDFGMKVRQYYGDYNYNTQGGIKEKIKKAKEDESLRGWLGANINAAREKSKACAPVLEEIERLQEALCQAFGLKAVLWDCGWNVTHFRGCLQSFQALAEHHAEDLIRSLKGRTLVFGNHTGVSLDGRVLLNSGEVRHNWLDFIKNVWKDDLVLHTVPGFEKAVSRVLRDIKVVRRKFQFVTMAKQYENNLRRLTTSLSDYQGRRGYPKEWPMSLENYELVVETEAGPLMLSPTGQFIVPASCPSFLLVNFITEHLDQASDLLKQYKLHKDVENELLRRCKTELKLAALSKDDCITPNLMIPCCQQLLAMKDVLGGPLQGSFLFITNYYSVMSDGQICIPWNFKM